MSYTAALIRRFQQTGEHRNPMCGGGAADKYTLQLGLYNFFGQHMVDWPNFMAASLWVLAPVAILFFFTQKTFIEGITFTGLKG